MVFSGDENNCFLSFDCTNISPVKVELKLKYKFRLILDESWSFGVLGRTGRGVTEHQNVDAAEVDMITGSLAGPLVAGGGFCAGSEEIVNHQRIASSAYTFSAALPALLGTTASVSINYLQNSPETIVQLREYTKALRAQLYPRSDWVYCTSDPENPVIILTLKPEVVSSKRLSVEDQKFLLQDIVDEVRAIVCSFFFFFVFLQFVTRFELYLTRLIHYAVSCKWCSHNSSQDPR